MKKYLFAGLITLFPIMLTIIIVVYLFNLFTTPFVGIVESLIISFEKARGVSTADHETLIVFLSRVITLIFLFVLILILGYFGRKFFFDFFLKLANKFFLKIPFVKSIYRISREITNAMFSQSEKTFKQTVLIPFPTKETHAIGFVTGDVPPNLKKVIDESSLSVFVPTAPHPMSGYMLLTAKKHIIEVDIGIEDAFKFLVSCGTIHPGEPAPAEKNDNDKK